MKLVMNRRHAEFVVLVVPALSAFMLLYQGSSSDWSVYQRFVLACGQLGCTYFEPGFDLLVFAASKFGGFWLLRVTLIFCAILSIFAISRLLSESLRIGCLIFFSTLFPLYLGAIRQAIAATLVFCAAAYVRRLPGIFVFCCAAISIHLSAFVAFFLYALKRFQGEKLLVAMAFLLLFYFFNVSASLGRTGLSDAFVQTSFSEFKERFVLAERIAVALVCLYLVRSYRKKKIVWRILVVYWGLSWFALFYEIDRNMAGRMAVYFRVFEMAVYLDFLRNLRIETIFIVFVGAKIFFTFYGATWF